MLAWWRTIRLSIKELLLHPLRSSLTVLGIFIGVASVIWLLAIGEGIGREAEKQIIELGARNIIVRTVKPSGNQATGGGLRSNQRRFRSPTANARQKNRATRPYSVRQQKIQPRKKRDGRACGGLHS